MGKPLDLAALFVAICALGVSFYQGTVQSKLEVINKQPLLNIEFIKNDSEEEKGFKITNAGFGPAIITSFTIYNNENSRLNKKGYDMWLENSNVRFYKDNKIYFHEINNLTNGYVMPTGSENSLFLLGTTESNFYNSLTAHFMNKVVIEIRYKSISYFDDKEYLLIFCENSSINNKRSATNN
jgi:hypothetical protein